MKRLLNKLHTVTLVGETENLSHASSGAIESGEMSVLLKLLGQKTTEVELQKFMDDVDANSDGIIDFPEFLGMMARLTDGVTETSPVKLKKLSHYGRDTLLRWIRDDPEELDGDVTGSGYGDVTGIAPFRRTARRVLMHRKPENFVYFGAPSNFLSMCQRTFSPNCRCHTCSHNTCRHRIWCSNLSEISRQHRHYYF